MYNIPNHLLSYGRPFSINVFPLEKKKRKDRRKYIYCKTFPYIFFLMNKTFPYIFHGVSVINNRQN
jgi:hypothetical protein